jgi:hypothetical protein
MEKIFEIFYVFVKSSIIKNKNVLNIVINVYIGIEIKSILIQGKKI